MKVLKNRPSEIMSITPSTPLRLPDTATMSNNDNPNTMVRTANTLKLMRQIAFMQAYFAPDRLPRGKASIKLPGVALIMLTPREAAKFAMSW